MPLKARAIAFYLPQYHPTPENDKFWGIGFTEWTNVTKARPLFRGHTQPRLPADLGFYDLRVPAVRKQQAALAQQAGIEGFCYWHYWFGNGKRTLDRIFTEVLDSGEPDFPFCLGWANESWTGKWHGLDSEIIFEQTYPGVQDYIAHFHAILPAFLDERYLHVNGQRIFILYRPELIPDLAIFLRTWNDLAQKNGLPSFYFISANTDFNCKAFPEIIGEIPRHIYRYIYTAPKFGSPHWFSNRAVKFLERAECAILPQKTYAHPIRCSYKQFSEKWTEIPIYNHVFPCAIPNWDNTPRAGARGYVIEDASPELFKKMVSIQIGQILDRPLSSRLIFVKSWNEWAEGNYLEPDSLHGLSYIEAMREALAQ